VDDASVGQQLFLGKYAYDLYKREVKKIVEINGTYWHADPRVYQDESKKLVHGTVQEIRLKDEQKISYAKSIGWDVLIVWEFDYCKSPNDVIESIIRFFKNE
jgi:very-short-patch-repair endonuclease